MKLLAIQASANADGLTASLAKAALEGAGSAGATTELIHLNTMNVDPNGMNPSVAAMPFRKAPPGLILEPLPRSPTRSGKRL